MPSMRAFVFLARPCAHSHPRARLRTRLKVFYPVYPNASSRRAFSSTPKAPATHHDTPASSLLSQTLDQRQRMARGSQTDNVGPFTLGMVQQPMGVGKQDVKKWSELSTKGKVMRTTARTSNFTVIVLGAGLTAMLAYALASELFARNSPTVLYGEACSRIKASEKISQLLPGSLAFHNNPPSATRPRHRNRHVSSQLAVDSAGREHLLLNFYVRVSKPGSKMAGDEDEGYVEHAWRTVQGTVHGLGETSWDEAVAWGTEAVRSTQERARRLFLYLTGESVPSSSSLPGSLHSSGSSGSVSSPQSPVRKETQIGRGSEDGDGGLWASVTGLFSGIGLKGLKGSASTVGGRGEEKGEAYDEGEVHCDLVKDESGNFVWRYIIVDMPNSRASYPNRVFVERSPEVRDREAVMRWY